MCAPRRPTLPIMNSRGWTSALFVGCLAVGTAACGSSTRDSTSDTVADRSVLPAAPTVPGEPDAAALAQALDELGDATGSYRVVGYSAQVNRIPAAGIDIEQQIDPERPTSVAEVDAEGDVHATIDLSALFAAMGGPAADVDQISIESWQNAERAVIDTEELRGTRRARTARRARAVRSRHLHGRLDG
jgi:hypothetical protein